MKPTISSSVVGTGPTPRPLRRAFTVTLAAAGPVAAVALLATLGGASDMRTLVHVGAAALALGGGLMAVIDLQGAALENRARGRSVVVGPPPGGPATALTIAIATIVLVLVVSATIELLALGASRTSDDQTAGSKALEEARQRRDGGGDVIDPASARAGTDVHVIGPNASRAEGSGSGDAAVGDLLSGAMVFRVRPAGPSLSDASPPAPLHLRGFVLDAYDRSGRLRERRGTPRAIADGDDGSPDGWLDVAPARRTTVGRELVLDVEFVANPNGLVFAPSQLLAVRAESADLDRAQESLRLPPETARAYRTRSLLPSIRAEELRRVRARGSLGVHRARAERALDVPVAERSSSRWLALEQLRAYAKSLVNDSRTDVDSVLAIVQHLRSEFSYEIYNTQFLRPEDFSAFRDRGAGSCTHFASLAVLLLRLEGIPARLAAGYVAREVDPATGDWIVRQRDAHAWIEVHFERFGWLMFDPTPGDLAVGGTLNGWSPLADESLVDVDAMRRSEPRTSPLGRILVGAFGTLARWFGGAREAAAALAIALTVIVLLLLVLRRLGGPRRGGSPGVGEEARRSVARPAGQSSGVAALLRALRDRGWSQGARTTPTAFATQLEEQHDEARGLRRAFGLVLRRACTGGGLDREEEAQLREVGHRIRLGPDGPEGGPAGPR